MCVPSDGMGRLLIWLIESLKPDARSTPFQPVRAMHCQISLVCAFVGDCNVVAHHFNHLRE